MKKKLATVLVACLIGQAFPSFSMAALIPNGVANPYDGSDVGSMPGEIQLKGTYPPGSTVSFSDTDGNGYEGGLSQSWYNPGGFPVNYGKGQANITFPDGSTGTGQVLEYQRTDLQKNNGYLLVADKDIPDWVSAMQGNLDYVNSKLNHSTMEAPSGIQWSVAPLPDVINFSGGIIEFGGGGTQDTRFIVNSDGTTAHAEYKVIPTPSPTAEMSIAQPQASYTVGDKINLNLVSHVSAANTNYHYVAVHLTGNGYDQYLPVTGNDGKSYAAATGTTYDKAVAVAGGNLTNTNTTQTYTDTGILDTAALALPNGTYKVDFILYDEVARQATTQTIKITLGPPPAGPAISLSANPTSLDVGGYSTLTTSASNVPNGDSIVIKDISLANTLSGSNQVSAASTTAVSQTAQTVQYQAFLMNSQGRIDAQSNTVSVTWSVPAPVNQPPKAIIDAPETVMAGEDIPVSGARSYDPDGRIVKYQWDYTVKPNGSITGQQGTIWYPTPGTYQVVLTVTDDKGLTNDTRATIQVVEPKVKAVIAVSGTQKENRKFTLDATQSQSPTHYPIDWSKTQWTITAQPGGIYDVGSMAASIRTKGSYTGNQTLDMLIKLQGPYNVHLYVQNTAGYSDETDLALPIDPDLPPTPSFQGTKVVYRDIKDQDYGADKIYDTSISPDGDYIANRVWKVQYDSNNDGIFSDEPVLVIDESTLVPNVEKTITFNGFTYRVTKTSDAQGQFLLFKLNQVGKYHFELEVTEGFGQPTMPEFILPSDYKKGSTE
ncbi:PKD domain-containing protein [Effusibacillus dendaii]|uniref:PKD domain-containing protein n=1 Tax=Effusibacillus dendaii TaxID=2743772 RepID=A0A7I8DDH3_9BACL|nr:PKD domain-containing protein [Effusibacillus dendaii]BCJ88174.1 hypothetical protein skT53_31590 [Effusibacillus dendaii]